MVMSLPWSCYNVTMFTIPHTRNQPSNFDNLDFQTVQYFHLTLKSDHTLNI